MAGKTKKIGALAVLGAATGATVGLARAGVASVATAGFVARATRNFGIAHLERHSGMRRADLDKENIANYLRNVRWDIQQEIESGQPVSAQPVEQILAEQFTKPANKQARKNKLQPLIGFAAVGLAGVVGHLVREYLAIINEPAVHLPGLQPNNSSPKLGSVGRPYHPRLPSKLATRSQSGSKQIFVNPKEIAHSFVASVYERAEGLHRGFTDMLHAAHNAIAHGQLIKSRILIIQTSLDMLRRRAATKLSMSCVCCRIGARYLYFIHNEFP